MLKTKILFYISLCILFTSCAAIPNLGTKKEENSYGNTINYFLFKDVSGQYIVKREKIENEKQLVLRQTLFPPGNEKSPLEKSVTVAKLGTVNHKGKRYVASRPYASQFSIWFEKKEFFSQLKLNVAKKGMDVYLKSPDEKWQGNKFKELPKGLKFCWFSQVPECLKRITKLDRTKKKSITFYIVWDAFPYYSEQLQNLSGQLYSLASVYYDGEFDKTYRFGVNVENQIIFYHFNYELEFERMFWIAQNITMVKR
jgi:hypothetical protein